MCCAMCTARINKKTKNEKNIIGCNLRFVSWTCFLQVLVETNSNSALLHSKETWMPEPRASDTVRSSVCPKMKSWTDTRTARCGRLLTKSTSWDRCSCPPTTSALPARRRPCAASSSRYERRVFLFAHVCLIVVWLLNAWWLSNESKWVTEKNRTWKRHPLAPNRSSQQNL